MTDASINQTLPRSPSRIWRVFDVALLVFVVFNFLFAILASLFATYRVGRHPLLFEGILVWRLLPLALVLFVVGLVCLIIRAFRKRVTMFSVIAFICLGADVFFVWIPFGFGHSLGRRLLEKNGIDQRVAQECLLIAQSDLCKTGAEIRAYSGTWELDSVYSNLAQTAHDLQLKCLAICVLKPTSIDCSLEEVRIEMHGGFDHFGYWFGAEETNWVLRWYEEGHPQRELVRLPHEKSSLIVTDLGPWQIKQSN